MFTTQIKSKVLSGLKWNSIGLVATRSTDFIVKLILARILLPEAYGVVGMAMLIINFLSVFSDMGLFNALVQKKNDELTQDRYSSAFWYLLVLASVFVVCFFLFISPLGASFYNEPKLLPVLNALSFFLFFNILSIVPRVVLTKQLNFKSLIRITYFGSALSSVIAIGMAFLNFGVWSLVAKTIVGSGVVFLSYWIKVGWRPKFVFRYKLLREMASYSVFTQINAILFFFRNNLDYLIIGKLVSARLLGVYTLAFTLSETLRSQLYSIFNKVFFPIYSTLQDDIAQIKYYYLKIMRLTAVLTFPISILFIGLAESVIQIFFGRNWVEAAAPLRVLSIASMIFAISGTPNEVLKSIGKPFVGFFLNVGITFLIGLPGIYFGQKYLGLAGVGYAVCLQYIISRVGYHYYMKKYINLTDKEVYDALKEPVIASLLMLGTIYLVGVLQLGLVANFILASLAGVIVYSIVLHDDLRKMFFYLKKRNSLPLLGFITKAFEKRSYIFHFGDRTYKLYTKIGMATKVAEVLGNQTAQNIPFWSNNVLKIKSKSFIITMPKAVQVKPKNALKVEQFLATKLQETLSYPRKSFNETFDFAYLKKLEQLGLEKGLLDQAAAILSALKVPVTGAHGDFHMGNLVYLKEEVKAIDWSMFMPAGSFVMDYINYYNCNYAEESWTASILRDHLFLKVLSTELATTPKHLRLAYTICRINGEVRQSGQLKYISKETIAKYNNVLFILIHQLDGTIIQRHNTVIQ